MSTIEQVVSDQKLNKINAEFQVESAGDGGIIYVGNLEIETEISKSDTINDFLFSVNLIALNAITKFIEKKINEKHETFSQLHISNAKIPWIELKKLTYQKGNQPTEDIRILTEEQRVIFFQKFYQNRKINMTNNKIEDNQILCELAQCHGAEIQWTNEPDEFEHIIKFTPSTLRAFLANTAVEIQSNFIMKRGYEFTFDESGKTLTIKIPDSEKIFTVTDHGKKVEIMVVNNDTNKSSLNIVKKDD